MGNLFSLKPSYFSIIMKTHLVGKKNPTCTKNSPLFFTFWLNVSQIKMTVIEY